MDYLLAFLGLIILMVVVWLLNRHWQRKHRRVRQPRHAGEPQSQRGRVYKDPPSTNHSADPYSGWP